MTDTTDNLILAASVESQQFQDRVRMRFLIAGFAVMTEVTTCTATATTSPPSTTVPVTGVTVSIVAGITLQDTFNLNAVNINAIVTGATGSSPSTGTLSLSIALSGTITNGDILTLTPPNHAARSKFAGDLFRGTVDLKMLCMAVLASPTNRANCLANPQVVGGNILDADLDTQINSIFTGLALASG